MIKNIKLI